MSFRTFLFGVAAKTPRPARTVREYTSLLVDTLVPCTLDPWQRGGKRKAISRSKLYFFDLGVARVLGDDYPVEVKAASRLTAADFRGLRENANEKSWKGRFLVCREPSERLTDDGVLVVPIEAFLARLWSGGFK